MKKLMEYLDKVLPTVWGTALALFITLITLTGAFWALSLFINVLRGMF